MRREVEVSKAIFDLPIRKWHIPTHEHDFTTLHFSRAASTPLGPAAGPHTQLAQNIVLSWLGGGRIIELKTVQVRDRLDIPRPCIHVPNVGFNVEWSQELRVRESALEYAKAAYLIQILKDTKGFGVFATDSGLDTVLDVSIGYDLDGIRSEKVTSFIRMMQEPEPLFDELRVQLTGDLSEFRDVGLPRPLSDCVTVSTFHGCPADQIESIARYLIGTLGLHTTIKLNPTLLGFEALSELLVERLGYGSLELRRDAFDQDLKYDDAIEVFRQLRSLAERHGSAIGAKFTNSLVVTNNPAFFPTQREPYMYLSGPPLHVISMNLMQRFREDLGLEFPVSFSAGIDARNFSDAVACGMVPITTCTDLLRQGGYGRFPSYLRALGRAMERLGVSGRDAYVLAANGHGAEAVEAAFSGVAGGTEVWLREGRRLLNVAARTPDQLPTELLSAARAADLDAQRLLLDATRIAGRLNGRDIVSRLVDDSRYHANANRKTPRRIESTLSLYDCINCDLCISACPNDAIFAYVSVPRTLATEKLTVRPGHGISREVGTGFSIRDTHQLAVLHASCNECSNCEVYCPEEGAPFRVKERLFLNRDDFDASPGEDGFYRDGKILHARLEGTELTVVPEPKGDGAVLDSSGVQLQIKWHPFDVRLLDDSNGELMIDTAQLWRMKTVWEAIYHSSTPNMVNPGPAYE
jgi:putative selenate reductase